MSLNDKAIWIAASGALLIFEWQIVCGLLYSRDFSDRLSSWKYIRVVSQAHYVVILIGSFFTLKFWFPESNNFGLIMIGLVFFGLKQLSLLVSKYKAITEIQAEEEMKKFPQRK